MTIFSTDEEWLELKVNSIVSYFSVVENDDGIAVTLTASRALFILQRPRFHYSNILHKIIASCCTAWTNRVEDPECTSRSSLCISCSLPVPDRISRVVHRLQPCILLV